MGYCIFCGKKAGLLRKKHRECEDLSTAGWNEMVDLAAEATSTAELNEAELRRALSSVGDSSMVSQKRIPAAIAEGWRKAVVASLADGILTQDEELRLRTFRERMAFSGDSTADALAQLNNAVCKRLGLEARQAALASTDADSSLHKLDIALQHAGVSEADKQRVVISAYELAVESALDDGVLTVDEEASLSRYLNHFNLKTHDVDSNGAHRNLVQAAVIRDVLEGTVPQRITLSGDLPLNLQKSEKLVWVFNEVDYYELKTRRERRGTSHGVSIRIARGLYYHPRQFRSQTHEWDETTYMDTGLLGVTNKHIYFHGDSKRFRIRLDKIVSFEQLSDGFGLMRDAQTAKPQWFQTGDGWFIYNLVTNLAKL